MTSDQSEALRIARSEASGCTVLEFAGVLDGATYRHARDAILKAAVDGPPALVVDVTGVHAPRPSAWAVFTAARWLTSRWPDVPIGLVSRHVEGRRALVRNGISRYVPVYGDVAAAVAPLVADAPVSRRRVRQQWPAIPAALPAARDYVSQWLDEWGSADMIPTAVVVATALVDNVLQHTESQPDLRLECDGTKVTVAVSDGSTTPAAVREDVEAAGGLSELMIVGALTTAWGNTPTDVGKTVWAVMGPPNRI